MARDLNLYWLRSDVPTAQLAAHLMDPRPRNPELVALVTGPDHALVGRLCQPGAPAAADAWRSLDDSDLSELIDVIETLAGEAEGGLVESNEGGRYLMRWELVGTLGEEPFRHAIQFIGPGERWSRVGRRLREALASLNRALAGA